jgi:hypothetical protein
MHSKNPGNNLTPNCVTITESASVRKEQKFSVPRSARITRQDSRLGCRQINRAAQNVGREMELRRKQRDGKRFKLGKLRVKDKTAPEIWNAILAARLRLSKFAPEPNMSV